ncbi:MAG: hypothetical protein JNM84_17160 [Planctomycetes bacterium]|nr:hypothetical protein [Planctomycetota bacterium]
MSITRLLAALFLCTSSASSQSAPIAGRWHELPLDSGVCHNASSVERVVFHRVIELPAATPWVRVHFAEAVLSPGSRVRLTALQDGDAQVLDAERLREWQYGSAYFNGSRISLELIAAPRSAKELLRIEKLWIGDPSQVASAPENICGQQDDRSPSAHPAVGRLLSSGSTGACTAFLIAAPSGGSDRCHLSAGHCFGNGQVLQFNVPASSASCALVHPPATSQYAVDWTSLIARTNGIGDDYAVFRCFRNPTTNFTTFQAQASAIGLAASLPPTGANVRLTGFGVDGSDQPSGSTASCVCNPALGTGTRHQVQQTDLGTFAGQSGTIARHHLDACAGSSGSPLLDEASGLAIGIQTHGGCADPVSGASNAGTAITAPNLAAAIQTVCGGSGVPNDECVGATLLSGGLNPLLSSIGATPSQGAWSCGTSVTADVWHVFRASCNGTLTIDTCGAGTSFDTVLEIYEGSCGNLNLLACNDDSCATGSSVSATVVLGTNYYLRVGGNLGASGSYDLDVDCNGTTQVPNDECAGASTITNGTHLGFTNANATTSSPAWPCANGGSDVWFRYVASCTGSATVETCSPGTNYDSALEAFSGSCASSISLACNDDACSSLSSRITFDVVQGSTYYLRVGGFGSATGVFDLVITCISSGNANEECGNAIALVPGSNGPYSTATATTSSPAWPCAGGGNDLWFTYDAACSGTVVFDTCNAASFDTAMQVFDGPCGNLVSLGCNDDSCGLSSTVSISAIEGRRYTVRVGGFNGARGTFSVNLTVPQGSGSFQTLPNGCGTAILTPTGLPNLGAVLSFQLSGLQGAPLLWIGSPVSLPLCPPAGCTLGASFDVVVAGASLQVTVPCLPTLIGSRVAIQGADIGGTGGCAAGTLAPLPIALSSTLVATIG